MLDKNEVLIKRAAQEKGTYITTLDFDFEKSTVEEFEGDEYVVLRKSSNILSVFLVDNWQVTELKPENWPDYLLDEVE